MAIWGFVTGTDVWILHVNTAHNVVHLVAGVAALGAASADTWCAREDATRPSVRAYPRWSTLFCLVMGAVYGLVAVLGFAGFEPVVNLLHLNTAVNWLHLAIAVVLL